jgi:hypothetical protein
MWRALPLKFGQNGERRLDRPFGRPMDLAHDPEVDDLERVEPEMAQIVVDRTLELGRGHRRDPRCVPAAPGADLGDDDEMVGIRMERLADQMVGVVGPIIVAGVDMIDAARDRLAQYRDRAGVVLRRPEDALSRKLHRAVTHALHNAVAQLERSGFADVDHRPSPLGRDCISPAKADAIMPRNRHGLFGWANNAGRGAALRQKREAKRRAVTPASRPCAGLPHSARGRAPGGMAGAESTDRW